MSGFWGRGFGKSCRMKTWEDIKKTIPPTLRALQSEALLYCVLAACTGKRGDSGISKKRTVPSTSPGPTWPPWAQAAQSPRCPALLWAWAVHPGQRCQGRTRSTWGKADRGAWQEQHEGGGESAWGCADGIIRPVLQGHRLEGTCTLAQSIPPATHTVCTRYGPVGGGTLSSLAPRPSQLSPGPGPAPSLGPASVLNLPSHTLHSWKRMRCLPNIPFPLYSRQGPGFEWGQHCVWIKRSFPRLCCSLGGHVTQCWP